MTPGDPADTSSTQRSGGGPTSGRSSGPLADAGLPLGPLDGRYRRSVAPLVEHLSEAALNRERVHVEVEWLIHLAETDAVPGARRLTEPRRRGCARSSPTSTRRTSTELAEIERGHRARRQGRRVLHQAADGRTSTSPTSPSSCTSAAPARTSTTSPTRSWCGAPSERSGCRRRPRWRTTWPRWPWTCETVPMLARTHGQPATPTTLGKELAVLVHRLRRQLAGSGRPSTWARSTVPPAPSPRTSTAVPSTDWVAVSRTFVEGLGLTWNPLTTQIESHDWQAELYADVARFNRVLHNLCTDVWTYISLGYFVQVRARPGRDGLVDDAAQGEPDPLRERRGQPRGVVRAARRPGLDAGDVTAAARPHGLVHAAQHRHGVRALAAGASTTCAVASPGSRPTPDADGRRPRRQLGGARRGGPVGHARGGHRRYAGMDAARTSG